MYKDAYQIALRSGKGYTDIRLPPEAMLRALIPEDSPDLHQFQDVHVPTVDQVEVGAEA